MGTGVKLSLAIMTPNKAVVSRENKTLDDIYLDAGLLSKFFIDRIPVDLYRFVRDDAPEGRMILYPVLEPIELGGGRKRSSDVERKEINGIWYVFPKKRKGVSTFGGPVNFPHKGKFYVIPKGTVLPPGLSVGDDGISESFKQTHYSILPRTVMEESHFLFLLRRLASHAIPYRG